MMALFLRIVLPAVLLGAMVGYYLGSTAGQISFFSATLVLLAMVELHHHLHHKGL
jgi:uncharacterized membrane protein